jgi:hypothetical protein
MSYLEYWKLLIPDNTHIEVEPLLDIARILCPSRNLAVCQTPIVFRTNLATCSDEAGFCPVIKLPSCRV